MNRNSNKASRFVVTAHWQARPDAHGVSQSSFETFVFEPNATIEDIFQAVWSDDVIKIAAHGAPTRIEIRPDENSTPRDRGAFELLDEEGEDKINKSPAG